MSDRAKQILFFLIILAALALRLWGLHWGLPTRTLSLTTYHPDESYMFQVFEHMYKTHSLHPGKVGLFYGTLYFYIAGFLLFCAKLIGFVQIGPRDFLLQNLANLDRMYLIIRFFSVLCGIGTVIGTYFVAKRLLERTQAFWASFLVAFFPVTIAVSHYAKVDALLPFLILVLLWGALRLLERPEPLGAFLPGLIAGLLASTKYNAGLFIAVPLAALIHCVSDDKWKLAALVVAGAAAGFLIATPYALIDLPLFLTCLREQFGMFGGAGIWNMGEPAGILAYGGFYIPFGIGWPAWILCGAGVVLMILKREPRRIIFLTGFLLFLILTVRSGVRVTAYIVPLAPFFAIFAAHALLEIGGRLAKPLRLALFALFALYQAAYGLAFARLYSGPDPRELAGRWIAENVSAEKESIGIIRSYFWTPGILRQSHPPYCLLKGGDDNTGFDLSLLGLAQMKPQPDYFLESEMETRDFLRTEYLNPLYAQTLRDFLKDYTLVQSFERSPQLFGFRFWRRTPPWDFSMISPTTRIYRKQKSRFLSPLPRSGRGLG